MKKNEQNQDNQLLDEANFSSNLNNKHNLTESDFDNFDNISPLEHQRQQQKIKISGWRFDGTNSMTIYFYKTGDKKGSSFVKIPFGTSAILNSQNDGKCCFIWLILAHLHPCENSPPTRVKSYRQSFIELKFCGFDTADGFKCSDVHKFEKLYNLSMKKYELGFFSRSK